MPKFRVTLTTVASYVGTFDAEDRDQAQEEAWGHAMTFAHQAHQVQAGSVDINDAWDLRDAEIEVVTE